MERTKVNFWLPAWLKKDLDEMAAEHGGTFTSYVAMVLIGHVRAQKAMAESGMMERLTKAMEGVAKETIEDLAKRTFGEEQKS